MPTVTYNPCDACGCGSEGIQTSCCPNPIPTTLHATITGSGTCDGTLTLVYDPTTTSWNSTTGFGGCDNSVKPALAWECALGGTILVGGTQDSGSGTSLVCSPFSFTTTGVTSLVTACGCATAGTVTVTA